MSLINDVLKDLERRDASESAAEPPPAERHRASSPPRSLRWPLWIIAAAAIGVILQLSLDDRTLTERADPAEALTAQAAPHSVPAPAPSASESSDQTSDRSAEASPVGEVRASDGESAAVERAVEASDGIRRHPQSSHDTNRSPGVEDAHARQQAQEAPASPNAPDRNPEPAPRETSAQPQATPTSGTDDSERATISIRRADNERVESDALADAKRLLSRGQLQRAEARLRQLVGEQPGLTEAHELLASALIRRRQHDAAIRVLESGLPQAHDPAPLAALLGRLLIERGEIARARTVLDRHAPAMSKATDYHLLLAAAYRQAGDHERAAEHYRELTEHLPRRGAVWIGLGASLESLDRPDEAVSAYNRALDGDDDRAARFAHERLTALKPITGEPQ